MKKLIFSLILSVLMLTSCGNTEPQETQTSEITENSETIQTTGDTKVIIDHVGNEVTIPTNIETIYIDGVIPLASVYAVFEGNVDKLVGMESASLSAAKGSLLEKMFPEIVNVTTDVSEGEDINIEALMELNPSVIFYRAEDTLAYEKLVATGIPCVGFSTGKFKFNTIDTFNGWITLLGDVLGQESKAKGITEKGYEAYNEVVEVTSTIPEEDKKKVLIVYMYDENKITVYGSKHFSDFWIQSTGGINAAASVEGSKDVNMEQIYEFNPDVIYISNFTPAMPEDIINGTINGDDWSSISAVQTGDVYKIPLGVYRWYPPSSDVPLMFKWMAEKNYPELFSDIDMNVLAKEYYKEMFDLDVSDEDIEKVFNPNREAGVY